MPLLEAFTILLSLFKKCFTSNVLIVLLVVIHMLSCGKAINVVSSSVQRTYVLKLCHFINNLSNG